jgi:pimeloyl-ACP methyl ester carboxylesterase
MAGNSPNSGFIESGGAMLWFEMAGTGTPLILLHAGVADSRQWNREFESFQDRYRVIRYDLRGFGRSEPVDGSFTHLQDLQNVLSALWVNEPAILVGCSMGGGLGLTFALESPERVAALVMCGSGPSDLKLDMPRPVIFEAINEAESRGDLERVAELETQLWFDGEGRDPSTIDPHMRALALDMNRQALIHEKKKLGHRLPDTTTTIAERMSQLDCPLMIVVGELDIPYIQAAAAFIQSKCSRAERLNVRGAAHLVNMDAPELFGEAVRGFLSSAGL